MHYNVGGVRCTRNKVTVSKAKCAHHAMPVTANRESNWHKVSFTHNKWYDMPRGNKTTIDGPIQNVFGQCDTFIYIYSIIFFYYIWQSIKNLCMRLFCVHGNNHCCDFINPL